MNPVIISIVHRIREFSSLSLTTDVDQPRASKINEDKSAKIKALRKERKSVRPSCGECSIAEVVWRPGYGCRTGCVSSRPKESSKTGVNESLRGERERERERERDGVEPGGRGWTVTYCHTEGVDKDGRCSELHSVTYQSPSQDGSSVGSKRELE